MIKFVGRPSREIRIGVAAFARIRRCQMARCRRIGLAHCIGSAAVVARNAIADDADVIEANAGGPRHKVVCIMAIRAIVRRRHVHRLGVFFARGRWPRAIVACKAAGKIGRQRVIKRGRLPCRHHVAGTAVIGRSKVGARAARGAATVVAASAVGDVASETVIKPCRRPGNRCMARLAQLAGQKMCL